MLTDASTAFAFGDMHKEINRLFQTFDNVLILEKEDCESYSAPIEFAKYNLHSDLRDCSLKAGDDFAVRIMVMRGDPVFRISYKKIIRFNVSYSDSMYIVDEFDMRLLIFKDCNKVCCLMGSYLKDQTVMLSQSAKMLKRRVNWIKGEIKFRKLLEKG